MLVELSSRLGRELEIKLLECIHLHSKGDVIPTPESESEYDSRPFYTPDSGTGSFALESLEPVPSLVPAQLVG